MVNTHGYIDNKDNREDEFINWNNRSYTIDEYNTHLNNIVTLGNYAAVNGSRGVGLSFNTRGFNMIANNMSGIFGMPYQFSEIVDPVIEDGVKNNIGRKFNEKIFSLMPVLFLTPGQPQFMDGYGKQAKENAAQRLLNTLTGDSDENDNNVFDEGRYYSFKSDFKNYKKYVNISLRSLATFMGISSVEIPIPGKNGELEKLGNIDIEDFLNTEFAKLFGTQLSVPFFVDAETSISENFSNSTTESMISQAANGLSQTARELQFIMGDKDSGGVLKSMGTAVAEAGNMTANAAGELGEIMAGKNLLSRVTGELTTIVTGGKIIFPEIWSDSSYDKSYSINIKLRSPDPDPVSIFLNIYMPIILLVSMAAPRQLGNSSNSYESPFLVRASYKSIFACDLGIIQGLSINKGGPSNWNIMGHPITADISLDIKDLYGTMFISKRYGLICNTAQMDYLATMAGIDLNEYEPTRMIKLYMQILGDTPRDIADNIWGGIKQSMNRTSSRVMSLFSDTRFLR